MKSRPFIILAALRAAVAIVYFYPWYAKDAYPGLFSFQPSGLRTPEA